MDTIAQRLNRAQLYLVCDGGESEKNLSSLLRGSLSGGVDIIQLRDKQLDDDGLIRTAKIFRAAADDYEALFILNDRPDLVAACNADGVHIGQDDGESAETRRIIGPDRILGRSTHAPEQALAAQNDDKVDYLSIGPIFETPTKPGRPGTGIQYATFAAENIDKPWFTTGNINQQTLGSVIAAGTSRTVVVRALTQSEHPEATARQLRELLPVISPMTTL